MSKDIHIVDDDAYLRTLYAKVAKRFGISAQTFSCPDAYLEYMDSDEYSSPLLAIFTDVEMPEKTGFELMVEVRKINPRQRFVILTGSPEVEPKEEFACFYFKKPISIGKLKTVFDALSKCVELDHHPDCTGSTSVILDDRCDFCVKGWHCPQVKH